MMTISMRRGSPLHLDPLVDALNSSLSAPFTTDIHFQDAVTRILADRQCYYSLDYLSWWCLSSRRLCSDASIGCLAVAIISIR
jgi:hypothetical protein|tara:strand:- start:26570 stop:26818 length:249 start_codon:yes stop_codon:yes gene_type:complete